MKSSSSRRYVVLGADGFIGSAVVRAALRSGADVVALCVRDPWRLADIGANGLTRKAAPEWNRPTFVPQLRGFLSGADAFIHLAYQPPPPGDPGLRENHERRVNVRATEAFAEATGDVPLIFASSADVYGSRHEETVDELTVPKPASPYAVAKLEAERSLPDRSTAMRISTVYGPGELVPRAIPSFIKACLSGGTAVLNAEGRDVKDYVPLGAVAEAFVAAANTSPTGRRVFNVSSGVGRSTAEVLEAVVDAVGSAPITNYVDSDRRPFRLVVSPELAKAKLGFDPPSEFGRELFSEIAWLRANRAKWA